MTECTFEISKNGEFNLECIGHAAEEGDDPRICVAVTTLLHTLAFNLEESASQCEEKKIECKDGYYHITVKPKQGIEEQMEFLFGAFMNGLYMLSEVPELKSHITFEYIDNRPFDKTSEMLDSNNDCSDD